MVATPSRAARPRVRAKALARGLVRLWPVLLVYVGTRALLIGIMFADRALRHQTIASQLANWDGVWYRNLALQGYPRAALHTRTTLGFFPLYSLMMAAVSRLLHTTPVIAGVVISMTGGAVAAVLVAQLSRGWWGEAGARRAAVMFSLFCGSVVFAMDYSEGLLIPLAAGCLLALERRRWWLAGVLAALATATGPDAVALIVACAVAAALQLRRRGWRDRAARRSLVAPFLSSTGILAFAGYLWAWTGTPLASLEAQRYGWGERSDPLALVWQVKSLVGEISFTHFNHPTINLNLPVGLFGVLVLAAGLWLLLRRPRRVPLPALTFTLCIGFLTVTSEYVPPNPRMLITASPVVLVFAHRLKGRPFIALAATNSVLLAVMSAVTFVGHTLRP